ncbi:putative ankyrin repeat protein RF_0381 [Physella acuta]|uniref:putative ankyrin repeat protein RF_0381 n=1 Tax=Physella acuta TaxID=109671 RepID=UPI0027DDD524|nr:putative ankyrin repeat protein RF_0381 [Physella acuta]XP_059170603.1 putative ankyrin repeat protein RF_0381 [Physella acuta]
MGEEKASINSNQVLFFDAVRSGNCKKVKMMLKKKQIDVNCCNPTDPSGPTAIIVSSQLQLIEMVKLLMKARPKGANVNLEANDGRRAIWWAAKTGNVELTKILLSERNCDVNYIDKETGCTPLYRAVLSNSVGVVRELIQAGADVNTRRLQLDKTAETPLMKAIQLDNIEMCQLLINSMCKIQSKTGDGFTALHFAVVYRRYDICELLLQNLIKVNAKTKHGVTAMTVAIEQHNAVMVRLLIQFGYRLDKKYSWGETPLEQAIKLHSSQSALTLIQWGCNLKRRCSSYFHLSVCEKLWDVAKILFHINPVYLHEKWLREEKWPVSCYNEEAVKQQLLGLTKKVWSLREQCRAKIFKLVGKYAPAKIDKLPVSKIIKDYLKFSEFIKDSFYEKKPLDELECPYECPIACTKWNCYALDISISSDSDQEFFV